MLQGMSVRNCWKFKVESSDVGELKCLNLMKMDRWETCGMIQDAEALTEKASLLVYLRLP